MPEPTPLGTSPDEPVKKSGFDPREHEAEQAELNAPTALSELPPRKRMYYNVIGIAKRKLDERVELIKEGAYQGVIDEWHSSSEKDSAHALEIAQEKVEFGHWHILDKTRPGGRLVYYASPVSLVPLAFELTDVFIPPKQRTTGLKSREDISLSNHVVISLASIDLKAHAAIDTDDPEGSGSGYYWIVLSPERDPVIIQERFWDKANINVVSKLANYPHHELTDIECETLIRTLDSIPV